MASQGYGTDVTEIAGADLSAAQFLAVKLTSTGLVIAGAGDFALGILQNKPANGQAATVRIDGKSKFVAGGAVTKGALLASDAAGKAKAATAGATTSSNVIAQATEAAAGAGQIIGVYLTRAGAVPTTNA